MFPPPCKRRCKVAITCSSACVGGSCDSTEEGTVKEPLSVGILLNPLPARRIQYNSQSGAGLRPALQYRRQVGDLPHHLELAP